MVAHLALAMALHLMGAAASAGDPVMAFATSPEIEQFAREVVATSAEPSARAHALYAAILALKRSGVIAADRDNSPKARRPNTAAELMHLALHPEAAGERKAGCYELSALFVAAARSVGLLAVGVERDEPTGTGQIGHIMAGVRSSPGGRLTIFDLQNEALGSAAAIRELPDVELAAHHYNHLAVAAFLNRAFGEAQSAVDRAVAMAPNNASFLNNRATILLARGEPILAIAEAAYAVELAPAVPLFRYQLGRLYLVTGELGPAAATLAQALALRPRYGLARRDLGWTKLLVGDDRGALHELEVARRQEPNTPDIYLYLGLGHLVLGAPDRAAALADEGVERLGGDQASLLALRALARHEKGAPAAALARLRQVLDNVRALRQRHGAASSPEDY